VTTPTWSIGNRRRRRTRRAFTLVEMAVVIVLVAVLVGMTAPMLGGAAASRRCKEQAAALLTAARYAREYAVTHRVPCRLAIDTATGQCTLEKQDEDATGAQTFASIGLGWGKPVVLTNGVRFGRVQIEPAEGRTADSSVMFRPTGEADAAVIEVTDGRWTYTLLILPTSGRARLMEGVSRGIPNDRVDLDA
jgi:prepilin-type N-terminal cleavage/methylation domain-containing protein